MEEIYTGVYGDHSSDGWLEWGLAARFAESKAREEHTPASEALSWADTWRYDTDVPQWYADLRADEWVHKAGLLAAAEAGIRYGVQIDGWESEEAEQEFRRFYGSHVQEYAAALAAEEARANDAEITGDFGWPDVGQR